MPSRCRIVACRSWTCTLSWTAYQPYSSVAPWATPPRTPPPASHMSEQVRRSVVTQKGCQVCAAEDRKGHQSTPGAWTQPMPQPGLNLVEEALYSVRGWHPKLVSRRHLPA